MFGRKMTKRQWLWVLVPALGLGMFSFATARAYGGPFGGHFGHHGGPGSEAEMTDHFQARIELLMDAVDATDAQRAQVDGIVRGVVPQMFALMKEGRELRGQVKDALLEPKIDRSKLTQLQGRLEELTQEAVSTGTGALFDVADVLTPAQRQKIADKLARFHR